MTTLPVFNVPAIAAHLGCSPASTRAYEFCLLWLEAVHCERYEFGAPGMFAPQFATLYAEPETSHVP